MSEDREEYSLTSKPLALATILEIWEELQKRTHAAVLGIVDAKSEDDPQPQVWTLTYGSRVYCRGMIEELRDELVVMSRNLCDEAQED